MTQMDADGQLLALLSIGDSASFETIYKKYAAPLFAFTRKNISHKEDCEEIIQDVFESLWNRREELKHITSLQAYLYQAVRYKIIRFFQHQKVKQKYADNFRLFEAAYESIPDLERNAASIQERIEVCMKDLPDRCQQAMKLRLSENLSNSEIAQRMKISTATVENYMVNALRHLRNQKESLLNSLGN